VSLLTGYSEKERAAFAESIIEYTSASFTIYRTGIIGGNYK